MNIGKTLFAQVMEFVPWKIFGRIIERHRGDAGVRTLGCADVFRILAFAQLTWRESLRDIEACLAANQTSTSGASRSRTARWPMIGNALASRRLMRLVAVLLDRVGARLACHSRATASNELETIPAAFALRTAEGSTPSSTCSRISAARSLDRGVSQKM